MTVLSSYLSLLSGPGSMSSLSDRQLIRPGRERAELPAAAIWAASPGKPIAAWGVARAPGACLGRGPGEEGVARYTGRPGSLSLSRRLRLPLRLTECGDPAWK